ncbi:MAG: hypothetical protein KAS12_02245 [Candidatus Aenigmarchaeota archaeon]|nr:hypothetical protein [Candidatus Aenigmarchaeota archaeon]
MKISEINLKDLREFIKENTYIVMHHKFPCVLEWDENIDNGAITDILPRERVNAIVSDGYVYQCNRCEEFYQYFTEYLEHMKEEFIDIFPHGVNPICKECMKTNCLGCTDIKKFIDVKKE